MHRLVEKELRNLNAAVQVLMGCGVKLIDEEKLLDFDKSSCGFQLYLEIELRFFLNWHSKLACFSRYNNNRRDGIA